MTKKYILLSILLLLLTTCGGYDHEGTSGTGNIAFKIDWQGAPTQSPPLEKGGEGGFERTAPLDCIAASVSTVTATVKDSSDNSLTTGGPWNCSAGSGNIEKVPAGSNRKVVVEGKDSSGSVLYRGEQTGITVVNGQTSPTVTVTVTPYTPTSTATTVTDIDGNVYNTVTIGTQVWMKENLKVTKYRNGDAIPTTTSSSIPNDSSSKYQWAYNDNESNVATYGRLYTWYAATDSRGLCPSGWHLPTDAEWTTLTDYLGGESIAGGKMKEAGTTHWNSPNTSADNSSGFTGLPGGYRHEHGSFETLGLVSSWWSATKYDPYGWSRSIGYVYGGVSSGGSLKYLGFSVRCVRG